MAITEQFAGLEMEKLIGAPLAAAADAGISIANSTAEFINRVGMDQEGKVRTASFHYYRRSANEDGTSNLDEMKVEVPVLSIVPIPNLQIDEVNVLFDMEVKQSEKKDTSMELSGGLQLGGGRLSLSGSISAHSTNTRSTDHSAKYHVDIKAVNHGTPEGLSRVLDLMAENIAPVLMLSELRGNEGQELSDQDRKRAQACKRIREETANIKDRLNAAKDSLSSEIKRMKRMAAAQQNTYTAAFTYRIGSLEKEGRGGTERAVSLEKTFGEVSRSFENFQNRAAELIKILSDSKAYDSRKLSELFGFKAWRDDKADAYGETEGYYKGLLSAQNHTVELQTLVSGLELKLLSQRTEHTGTEEEGPETKELTVKADQTGKTK